MATPEENNALALTEENNEMTTPESQPNKRRKKKSIVWEHFTIENVGAGCRRACCNQCKQSFAYSTGSKVAGTSHLKRHIAKGTCPALLRNQGNQLTPFTPGSGNGSATDPPKRRYRSPSSPYVPFDADRCRHEIARMIILHDYPLHMVEHSGFVNFVQNLQPRFSMVSFNTVHGDCVATYLREKQNVMKFIEGMPGRVCLTLDLWTSNQSLSYVFVTGHFIDSDWKPHKRILNVVMEPYPDSDTALSHAVACCLSDWSLEGKLFSVTYNHPVGEPGLENLRSLLCIKNPLILNGQLLIGNCSARILSSLAKDVLWAGRDIIKKIRDSVKYVKTSESHEEKFVDLKQHLQVPSEKSLSIDDQSQWNTTYQMLVAASELKEVFSCLDTSDPDYKEAPSMEHWREAETICSFLKPLYDAANMLTSTTNPTTVVFFHEVWKIQTDLARAFTSEDPFISSITKAMQEKISKYWKDCSLVLAIAVVMDPRFKMKLVEFSFSKMYGEDAPTYTKIVDDGIHELFLEYVALPLPLTPTYAEEGNSENNMKTEDHQGNLLSDNGLTDFDVYIMETTSQQMKSELDQYLEESLLPRVQEFDVLGWWKLNKLKYPTLSKMARDILSIPVTTVGPDSMFDTTIKELDQYRSSLRAETVEALVCAKDWLQHGSAEVSNALVKMEF
ncbi:zinc finger BED domain-containing protein DAYSLEEPER isoform X2 [Ricinus communis]|nr:zinc finger BED domain-containing protein DAYSLEEPER isoform X2 [Ricinus communis]XP_015582571.1 zinc finger BED domain-containing protein DAYSLEEPER isoform X2 [Ricinus communis]XP_015582574.1 zinc finger BED domain-containing protein DAYSLEEPER isoform X2 [Ricinus communis]XP_048227492.1 zinc finger BED domain-containing protein DAYSLEEPER isoform X2 [Ricinus communis]|eukprot:XP_015582570.1 zinc finger BED domain-containing protein DAYSLEEPER [Ricinus communis]